MATLSEAVKATWNAVPVVPDEGALAFEVGAVVSKIVPVCALLGVACTFPA
jgi:hypothetical protein